MYLFWQRRRYGHGSGSLIKSMAIAENYFINSPVFLKYKKRFNFSKFKTEKYLKSVFINERIVEIPFALQAVGRLSEGSTVLDVGCSESVLSLQLAGLGYKVTGYDFRKYPYTHPNLEFEQGDILEIPFPEESFDAVTAISTIEHLGIGFYTDPRQVEEADKKGVEGIYRILTKGGVFIFSIPYGQKDMNQHQRVYDEGSVAALIDGFSILDKRFFINTQQNGRANAWIEASAQEAKDVRSGEKTNGVCLIKASK